MLCEQSKIRSAMETDDVIYENTTETSKPNHVKKKQLKYKKQNKIIKKTATIKSNHSAEMQ